MDILDKLLEKFKNADDRQREELVYKEILIEIQEGIRRDGLWAKALVDAEGDKDKVEALYIKYRAQSLFDEINKYNSRSERKKRDEVRKKEELRQKEEFEKEEERRRNKEQAQKEKLIGWGVDSGEILKRFKKE
jgi:hypothetical protein